MRRPALVAASARLLLLVVIFLAVEAEVAARSTPAAPAIARCLAWRTLVSARARRRAARGAPGRLALPYRLCLRGRHRRRRRLVRFRFAPAGNTLTCERSLPLSVRAAARCSHHARRRAPQAQGAPPPLVLAQHVGEEWQARTLRFGPVHRPWCFLANAPSNVVQETPPSSPPATFGNKPTAAPLQGETASRRRFVRQSFGIVLRNESTDSARPPRTFARHSWRTCRTASKRSSSDSTFSPASVMRFVLSVARGAPDAAASSAMLAGTRSAAGKTRRRTHRARD